MLEIASWTEVQDRIGTQAGGRLSCSGGASIATEWQSAEDPAWWNCIDALLKLLANPIKDDVGVAPTADAIRASLSWLVFLKSYHPHAPPTYITREPQGGVIIDRRDNNSVDGSETIVEITIYNNKTAEFTRYRDGHIVEMQPMEFRPPAPSKFE